MKTNFENKKNRTITWVIVLICMVSFGVIMQSCDNDSFLSETDSSEIELITKSNEFEDYIIAATDLQETLKTFEKELAIVDFANLETVIENGKKVRYLPATIRSLTIEGKAILLNEKKETLLNKYPQISTLELHDFANYVNNCVKQSARVNEFFLDKKINIYQPLLKAVVSENSFDNMSQLVGHLYNWTFMSNYVEVSVLFFSDGTFLVVLDDRNTSNSLTLDFQKRGDKYYYNNNKGISEIAHTHRDSYSPSPQDLQTKNNNPNCSWSIFYNGAFYSY